MKLWDRYGVYALSGAAAIVLAVFGWKWYEAERLSAAARAGAQFVEVGKLIREGKSQQAVEGFEQEQLRREKRGRLPVMRAQFRRVD